VLLIVAVTVHPNPFGYDSYCSVCGAERDTTEWQVQGHQWTICRFSSIHATPLSKYVSSARLVAIHSHVWLFAHGGGNGVRCALGEGDSLRNVVTNSNVVQLLQYAKEYGASDEDQKVLKFALAPDLMRTVTWFAMLVPQNGFSNKEQYRDWASENLPDEALSGTNKMN
jgi:hypothetical protein